MGFNPAAAEVQRLAPGDDWFEVLSDPDLPPGHVVELAGGRYRDARRLSIRCRGTERQTIVIRSIVGQIAVFERPDASQNTINLDGAEHLVLEGLTITGGSAGIRVGGQPGDVIDAINIRGCHLHHLGGVAVTCNHPGVRYRGCEFVGNHIHHTGGHGEGFYLGGNDASSIFCDGRIEGNYIHDLNGPGVSQGDGIEIKVGSHGNRLVANVMVNTNYPGITLYGSGGGEVNYVHRNLVIDCGDNGIQVAADAVVKANTILSAGGAGISIRKHQGAVPGRLRIENNVVLADHGSALRIDWETTDSPGQPIVVRNNQLHATAGHPVMRIAASAPVDIQSNRGSGMGATGDFQITRRIDWSPSQDEGHPAWAHLDRNALTQRIWQFAQDD